MASRTAWHEAGPKPHKFVANGIYKDHRGELEEMGFDFTKRELSYGWNLTEKALRSSSH
jgi:hypothetical protein